MAALLGALGVNGSFVLLAVIVERRRSKDRGVSGFTIFTAIMLVIASLALFYKAGV